MTFVEGIADPMQVKFDAEFIAVSMTALDSELVSKLVISFKRTQELNSP